MKRIMASLIIMSAMATMAGCGENNDQAQANVPPPARPFISVMVRVNSNGIAAQTPKR